MKRGRAGGEKSATKEGRDERKRGRKSEDAMNEEYGEIKEAETKQKEKYVRKKGKDNKKN